MSGIFSSYLTGVGVVKRYVLSILLLAASAQAFAGSPHLVLDINSQYTPVSSEPVWLGKMGNLIYFIARPVPSTTAGGAALFATDGTTAGTIQIAPIDGIGILAYQAGTLFISAGTKAYFLANTTAAGQEVWVTDGTATGTHLVTDTYPGPNGSNPRLLGLIGTDLVFAGLQSDNTMQVFRTDGTAAGTQTLSNFAQSQYGIVTDSVALNGKVFVALESGLSCCQPDLWVTDGTTAGTVQIDSNEGYPFHLQPSSLRPFGNSVALLTNTEYLGAEPSFVDTTTNALTILDTVSGPGSGALYAGTIAAMDGFVLYLGGDLFDGLQLWRSDGTLPGTTLVMFLGVGVQSASISDTIAVTRIGNRAVFLSENAQSGPQLWSSDGTAQGTVPLIATPMSGGFVDPLVGVVGTHGYYVVSTGSDYRIVVTDGTVAGTQFLTNAGPVDPGAVSNTQLAGDDNLTFINTYYNDTASGTLKHLSAYLPQTSVLTRLRDTVLGGEDDPPFADSGRLFFKSTDPVHGDEPWISDGTVAGTQMLANIAQEIRSNDSNPSYLPDVNGTLFFAADDGVHGVELWKSDGTATGTSLAFDIIPGATGSNPTQLVNWNGSLYFFTGNQYSGSLMRTTGPVSAVTTLATLIPEPRPTDPNYAQSPCYFARTVPFNGRLYFGANDGNTGFELWSTDGTAGGTTQVADIANGPGSSYPCSLTVFNGRLYFAASAGNGAYGYQLWSTDGTAAGTGQALSSAPFAQLGSADFVVFNSRMYFDASDANGVSGLYSTDGTAAGTQLVAAASADSDNNALTPIGVSNGRLVLLSYHVSSSSSGYQELSVSDGTPAGTLQLAGVQVSPGTPTLVTANLVYFMNSDSTGVHPWVSDGTAGGTHILADLNPGADSDVRWFANFNGEVYLSSNDATNGARIWRTDGTTAGTVVVGSSALPQPQGAVQVSGQNLFFAAADNTAGLELNVVQNNPPMAANDTGNSVNGAAVTINVLANDVDSDGSVNPATVQIDSQPAHGSVSVTQSGSVVYTPNTGYQGPDSFTYSETDNQGAPSNIATVTVTTTQPSPPPSGGRSGGGGAVDLLDLLALAGLVCMRKRAKSPLG